MSRATDKVRNVYWGWTKIAIAINNCSYYLKNIVSSVYINLIYCIRHINALFYTCRISLKERHIHHKRKGNYYHGHRLLHTWIVFFEKMIVMMTSFIINHYSISRCFATLLILSLSLADKLPESLIFSSKYRHLYS